VTIVAWQREMLFGEIVDEEMILNEFGKIVSEKWQWLETQYDYVELGEWVVMPNHFHGILVIHENGRGGSRSAPMDDMQFTNRGDLRIAPTPTKHKPLGRLIGAFKTVSTKQINLLRGTEGQIVWQRNYEACPEPVEGNISFATNAKWTGSPVTSDPTPCNGWTMMKIQTIVRRGGSRSAPTHRRIIISSWKIMTDKRPLKVFPSTALRAGLYHAHSDATAVRTLYNHLVKDGVDAWLDTEKL